MTSYRVAVGYSLLALARNRLAIVLLVWLIPLAITLVNLVVTREEVPFAFRGTGEVLLVGGEKMTMISGSLNAAALLVGFMMFSAAHRSGVFDRRLIAAGYSRIALLLAKATTLVVAAGMVAAYATLCIRFYWSPLQPVVLGVGIFVSGVVYGAMGLFLALFLPGELEGMVAIIMVSVIELGLQNPIASPNAAASLVRFLPSYGAMQTCVGAAFTDVLPARQLALSCGWLVGFGLVVLAAFLAHTRVHLSGTQQRRRPESSVRRVLSP
ncbi:ABC transporter permease [Solihabitans fulvus]|uniref:ABC transporter permease n=1 Tax=Solihabitans fulvus TaxID=1892852 RepID=A0A5B2X2J8_9PSEU|nr:ABC transporter permease [Solihabitans fulvus]KAA2257517.1 ABC transporter permease [Solihabitans fulvus]